MYVPMYILYIHRMENQAEKYEWLIGTVGYRMYDGLDGR